jgi:hypothetical protein
MALADAKVLLNAAEPGDVDVEHAIGPKVVVAGVAGMRVSRVHYNNRSSTDVFALFSVQIGTAAVYDYSYGERFMCVFGVADIATVVDGTRFDEWKRVIAPESRFASLLYGSDHVRRSSIYRLSGPTIVPCCR